MWFELPDAAQHIPALVAKWQPQLPHDDVAAIARQWLDNGYFVVDDCFPSEHIDRFAAEVDDAWFAGEPIADLQISDVQLDDKLHVHIQHRDLIAVPEAERLKAKERSNWRIGEFHLFNTAARQVFDNERVRLLCSMLFDRPGYPHFSLTFSKGSRQALHQDTCVFHVWPINALIGVWIALEDIQPGSGPLVYYPGSQREPLFSEFDNYPQTQRRTAPVEQAARYDQHVNDIAGGFERREFLAKKGQALFWHGMLIHGGSSHVDEGTTRKSFVIHYLPDGGNVGHRVHGPFNW